MPGVLFQGEMYNDDRMFVLHVCKCTVTIDADDIVTTTIYHDCAPKDSIWCLVTYRNTARYPAFRVDHFDSAEEACEYLREIEPTVPRISLGGCSPDMPLAYEEYTAWKAKNGLQDYDYKTLYLTGGSDAKEIVLTKRRPNRT